MSWVRITFSFCGWQGGSRQRWGLEPISKPTPALAALTTSVVSLLNCYNVCSLAPALKTTQASRQMQNAAPDLSPKRLLLTGYQHALWSAGVCGGPSLGVLPAKWRRNCRVQCIRRLLHTNILRTVAGFLALGSTGGFLQI